MSGSRWPRRLTASQRFWLKVWPRGDCWEWRGYLNHGTGYGRFNPAGAPINAHRFAYEAAKGAIPVGMTIDHLCRHRWCVKPSHLEVVTQEENVRRGDNRNREKTHCPRGHAYDRRQAVTKNGKRHFQRFCRTCRATWERAQRAARAAMRPAKVPATHCRHGHPWNAENSYTHPARGRTCRACRAAGMRRANAKLD